MPGAAEQQQAEGSLSPPSEEESLFWSAVQVLQNNGQRPPSTCSPSHSKTKGNRCGECPACCREDCGSCLNCTDKPKFGGRGARKQACLMRTCANPWLGGHAPEPDEAELQSDSASSDETADACSPCLVPVPPPAALPPLASKRVREEPPAAPAEPPTPPTQTQHVSTPPTQTAPPQPQHEEPVHSAPGIKGAAHAGFGPARPAFPPYMQAFTVAQPMRPMLPAAPCFPAMLFSPPLGGVAHSRTEASPLSPNASLDKELLLREAKMLAARDAMRCAAQRVAAVRAERRE